MKLKCLLLLISIMLLLTGCSSWEGEDFERFEETEDVKEETIMDVTGVIETAPSPDIPISSGSYAPHSLEYICSYEYCNELLRVTYRGYGINERKNLLLLEFDVDNRYVGESSLHTVHVNFNPNSSGSTDPSLIPFEMNKSYIVLLQRMINVYELNGEAYTYMYPSLYIPCDDLSKATLYGSPLGEWVENIEINDETTVDELVEYMKTFVKSNPAYVGQPFTTSTDLVDIVNEANNILTVEVQGITSDVSVITKTYQCRVVSVHKGSVMENDELEVMFPIAAEISMGDVYVLTLDDGNSSGLHWYKFSSPQAMYPLSELDSIMTIIQNTQAAE